MKAGRAADEARREPGDEVPGDVRISLLGGFRVSVGSRSIAGDEWRLRKAKSLIKLLALAPNHRMHRERVMDLLWPGFDPRAAANNLHHTLHVARRTLEPAAPGHLALRGEQLSLCPGGRPWVDVRAFEEAAAAARRTRTPAAYRAALDLYAGDLLPDDLYEDWAQNPRQELRRLRLALLVELAGLYEERGGTSPAVESLSTVVNEEPAHEEAHAGLMRLYARSGRRGEALRQYERLREALFRELGEEPDARSRRLLEDVLAGRTPRQPSTDLPSEEPAAGQHNLPAARTSFVGRERELAEVRRLISTTRLLTLTGAGGSGKTRLAMETARELAGQHADGAWLVELAPLSEGTLVPRAVAQALGVREQPGRPLTETLVEALREKDLLLVVDNCEHLVDATARLVDELLGSCQGLRVLATSREPLGLAGEVNLAVPPLTLPGRISTVEELSGYESVRLFVERALYRPSAFTLTSRNAAAVAEVCRKLDGIPLAIELAAARVGALAVEQISERLEDPLKLLTGGTRTATPRQRTLRGALDWSHELLTEPERNLFARLSVFAGGWTLDAADAVEDGDVLDLLTRLVDKSLVVAEAPTGGDGALRYKMLEPVRQYALDKLEGEGDDAVARRRHAEYYLALAERAEPELPGSNQPEWLERLEVEHDNLRAALAWSLRQADVEPGLRLATAAWMFWFTRGHLSEGRAWLERAISAGGDAHTEAKALIGVGWISMFQGDYDAARAYFERGLALFRELEDEDGIVVCLTDLGLVAVLGERRDIPVPALLEEAQKLRPRLTNPRTVANLLILSGLVAFAQGDLERAWTLHEESLGISREIANPGGTMVCLTNLGLMAVGKGDHDRASALLEENLHLARGADDKMPLQYALFGLAGVAAARGRPARAARLWGASEAVREVAGLHLTALARAGTHYDAHLEAARSQLGDAAFTRTWAEGRAMPQEEAVEYALSEDESAQEPAYDLTRREREVAVLVARGLTNRQVADELFISERTAGNHVARILRKLDLTSRAQLAAWATERRLRETDPA